MKILLAYLLLIPAAFAQQKLIQGELYARRGEYVPPELILTQEELNRVLFSESRLYKEELKKVKYFLINGELNLAKVFLQKLTDGQPKLRPVAHRYLGMIAFIEQDYQKSLGYLTRGELRNPPHYKRVCITIVLNKIILNETRSLEDEWDRCQTEGARDLNATNLVWLDTLVKLKLNPRPGITRKPFEKINLQALEIQDLKILLKLAIYLNQEDMVVDKLVTLLPEQLVDPSVRELAGHIFFRSGKFANAYKFIEDLKTPNSENIKGNLLLLREKYEIAYAQFRVALQEKQNSQNALERLVPIAWLLGDWVGGSKYAQQLVARDSNEANKQTILAAFEMQKGEYARTKALLKEIRSKSRRGNALEVNQIAAFTALMENEVPPLRSAAAQSCELYDVVNCWVLFQTYHWENFPLLVRRTNELPKPGRWTELTSTKREKKLTEAVYVFQQDIEELDDQKIKLIK